MCASWALVEITARLTGVGSRDDVTNHSSDLSSKQYHCPSLHAMVFLWISPGYLVRNRLSVWPLAQLPNPRRRAAVYATCQMSINGCPFAMVSQTCTANRIFSRRGASESAFQHVRSVVYAPPSPHWPMAIREWAFHKYSMPLKISLA